MLATAGVLGQCQAVHVRVNVLQPAAEEEDSYTKEETKTPRFVNLVHAASIQKQGRLGRRCAANGHTPRSGAYASEDAFAQQSVEQLERSGLVTSSLPEPLEQQVSSSHHGDIMVKSSVRYLRGALQQQTCSIERTALRHLSQSGSSHILRNARAQLFQTLQSKCGPQELEQ